jgi:adenylate cyclase
MTAPLLADVARRARLRLSAMADLSLSAKFVGLTAGLILLLSITAFISLRSSDTTVREIKAVVNFAIPAYGALARSHIRSLEQGVELRRTLLLAENPAASDDAIALHQQAFFTAQQGFRSEFANAKRLLEQEKESTSSEMTAAALGRLQETLPALTSLGDTYQTEASACIEKAAMRDLIGAHNCLVVVDRLRDRITEKLEGSRAGMFAVLQQMATDVDAQQKWAEKATMVVFVLSSILGLGVAAIGASRLIRAIRSVVHGAEAVERGNLETRIEMKRGDEIGRLAASFNRMTEGLRMRDRIRDMFGRYVDPRIAAQLIEARDRTAERGDRRDVAVLFCDLAGFTGLSEQVEPERLVLFLNAYFSQAAREIAATDGVIDKYIGDAVMAYWCPPFVPESEAAARAAEAALRCLERLPDLGATARQIFSGDTIHYEPRIRIGIATGSGITGSIGAEARRNYTVIGDTVNLASRLEGANKIYGTANLVDGRTAKALRGKFELREIDRVLLPGIDTAQTLFEILGRKGAAAPERQALTALYEQALVAYRRRDWPAAQASLEEAQRLAPEDGPTRTLQARIETLIVTPAARDGFSGVWRLGKEGAL